MCATFYFDGPVLNIYLCFTGNWRLCSGIDSCSSYHMSVDEIKLHNTIIYEICLTGFRPGYTHPNCAAKNVTIFEFLYNRTTVEQIQYHRYRSPFLDLHLSIANGFVSSKNYDKRNDFDFGTVNVLFWMVYTFRNLLGD